MAQNLPTTRSTAGARAPAWAVAGVALLALAAPAAGQRIRAAVDHTELTVEDQLILTVVIEGAQNARPTLPPLPDFDVRAAGQSTQMSFVNGRSTVSVSHTYLLTPRRPGVFTIGPAAVELDGRVHSSQPIEIRVLEASATPRRARDLFLTARVSTTTPYVGQQVIYTWRFYRRVRIADARLDPLEFEGLLVEDLGEVREHQATVDGVDYLVSEIRKALFPQEVGRLTLPASRLTCEVAVQGSRRRGSIFDDFFTTSTQTKVLRTEEIALEVRPLPPAPPGFSGLVGEFGVEARLSAGEVAVGESATLRLKISGTGNVQMIAEPRLPELPGLKVYDDRPEAAVDRSGGALAGYRSYSKALVPLEPAELTLPAVGVVYFDPRREEYRTARSAPLTLRVLPGNGDEELRLTESLAPGAGKVEVRILADDILPLYRGVDAVARPARPGRRPVLLAAGVAAPPLLFLATLLAERRRRRWDEDAGLRRRRGAARRVLGELRRLGAGAAGVRPRADEISRRLREYVGDKLDCEGCALTPSEAERALRGAGVDERPAAQLRALLERLEAAQYGAGESGSEAAVTEAEGLVRRLERHLGG